MRKIDNISVNAFDNKEGLTIHVKTEELQKELLEKLGKASKGNVKVELIQK